MDVNETKSTHITFTNKKITCPSVHLNSNIIPYGNSVKYLGLHLDSRLTWKTHIGKKRNELNIKYKKLYWLLGKNSQLALKTKVLLYKSMVVWLSNLGSSQLTNQSNLSKIQRAQSKILKGISNAPSYITNERLHIDLDVSSIREVISNQFITEKSQKYIGHRSSGQQRNNQKKKEISCTGFRRSNVNFQLEK